MISGKSAEGTASDDIAALGQILQGNVTGNGGLFQENDELVSESRKHVLEGLGHDNVKHRLPVAEAQASSCLKLSVVNGHDTGTEDLSHISAGVQAEGHDSHQNLVDLHRTEHNKVNNQKLYHNRAFHGSR